MIKPMQMLVGVLVCSAACYIGGSAAAQKPSEPAPAPAPATARSSDGWEYLVISGVTTNTSDSGSENLRKSFRYQAGREQFVVEKNLDKLGDDGWELVTVIGPPSDPVYYFKRHR